MNKPATILVVDDKEELRFLLELVLQQAGYRVLTANNGQEALATVRAQSPCLVLMDIKMPVMDGIEALMLMKQVRPDLPVMMMTAFAETERMKQAVKLGAAFCLAKPFDIEELKLKVSQCLEQDLG